MKYLIITCLLFMQSFLCYAEASPYQILNLKEDFSVIYSVESKYYKDVKNVDHREPLAPLKWFSLNKVGNMFKVIEYHDHKMEKPIATLSFDGLSYYFKENKRKIMVAGVKPSDFQGHMDAFFAKAPFGYFNYINEYVVEDISKKTSFNDYAIHTKDGHVKYIINAENNEDSKDLGLFDTISIDMYYGENFTINNVKSSLYLRLIKFELLDSVEQYDKNKFVIPVDDVRLLMDKDLGDGRSQLKL